MIATACVALLVIVFGYSAGSKLTAAGFGALRTMLWQLGLRRAVRPAAYLTVAVEAGITVLLLVPATALVGALAAAGLALVLVAGIGSVLRRGVAVNCACFGRSGARLDRWHLGRAAILLAVASAALALLPAARVDPVGIFLGALLAIVLIRVEDLAFLVRGNPAPHTLRRH